MAELTAFFYYSLYPNMLYLNRENIEREPWALDSIFTEPVQNKKEVEI